MNTNGDTKIQKGHITKINRVGPVDNRPPTTSSTTLSTKNKKNNAWHLTSDTGHLTCHMWHMACDI